MLVARVILTHVIQYQFVRLITLVNALVNNLQKGPYKYEGAR